MSPLPSANPLIPTLALARGRESPSRLRRGLRAGLIAASAAIIAVMCSAVYWVSSLGPAPLGEGLAFSALVVDRDGKLLRPYTTPEGRWRLPATRENVDPRFLELLLAYEDKRFRAHHGVDPLALGRALTQLITHGRIVSGASTITMQVARLLEPRAARSFKAKLRQMVRAIEIERALSKDEILALYLSLAPYGGNLEGVRAASLAYFGKEPRRLTLGEAAMLVGLPQSPEQRRPEGLVGRVAAAPILFDVFARTGKLPAPLPAAPKGALVAAAGKLPPPLQRFRAGVFAGEAAEPQLRIMFPPNNARLELAHDGSGKPDPIALKVTGGTGPLTVLVNGMPLPAATGRRTLFFEPEGPGFVRLTVMDGRGATDSVVVRLQ